MKFCSILCKNEKLMCLKNDQKMAIKAHQITRKDGIKSPTKKNISKKETIR
jgi:hypothetical protein